MPTSTIPVDDPNIGRWCLFRINDSPLWRGLYLGREGWGDAHVVVEEETMRAICDYFSEVEGEDVWDSAVDTPEGFYDLREFAVEFDGWVEDVAPLRTLGGT